MKRTIKITAAFLMLIATLGSCVKGDKGDTGIAGTNGTNGTNGNANVHAYSFTVNPGNWISAGAGFYYCDVPFTQITSDIVNSGTVSMFEEGTTGVWIAMPYSIPYSSSGSLYYGFNYSLGYVRVNVSNSSTGAITFSSAINYKAVVISASLRKANPNVNWGDYNKVMKLVNETETLQQNQTN